MKSQFEQQQKTCFVCTSSGAESHGFPSAFPIRVKRSEHPRNSLSWRRQNWRSANISEIRKRFADHSFPHMVLVYLPTKLGDFVRANVGKQIQHHGAYGFGAIIEALPHQSDVDCLVLKKWLHLNNYLKIRSMCFGMDWSGDNLEWKSTIFPWNMEVTGFNFPSTPTGHQSGPVPTNYHGDPRKSNSEIIMRD